MKAPQQSPGALLEFHSNTRSAVAFLSLKIIYNFVYCNATQNFLSQLCEADWKKPQSHLVGIFWYIKIPQILTPPPPAHPIIHPCFVKPFQDTATKTLCIIPWVKFSTEKFKLYVIEIENWNRNRNVKKRNCHQSYKRNFLWNFYFIEIEIEM